MLKILSKHFKNIIQKQKIYNLLELTNWFVEKNPLIFPDNVEDKTSVSHKDVSHYKSYMNSKIITTMCVVLCIFIDVYACYAFWDNLLILFWMPGPPDKC